MAITSPFSVNTPISYLILFAGVIYSIKIEYALILVMCSDVFFYRIPTGMPISPLFYIFSILNYGFLKYLQNKTKINIFHFFLLFFFVCYIYMSCSTSLTHSFDKMLMYLLSVLFIFAANNCRNFDFHLFNRMLYIIVMIVLSYVFIKLTISPIITETGRRAMIFEQNTNVLARNISYFFVACLFLLHMYRKKWIYLFVALSIGSILITGSRTSFFAVIFVAYVCSIYFSKAKKVLIKNSLGYVILAVTLFAIAQSTGYNRVIQVSSDEISSDVRFVSAAELYKYAISKNPWTGIGLGNENSHEILGYVLDSDNMYVDILTQLGIIGLSIIMFLVLYTLYNIVKLKNDSEDYKNIYFPFALILVNMSMSMTESIFDESLFYTSIALAYIYINSIKSRQKYKLSKCN